jgi:hypothetical protein
MPSEQAPRFCRCPCHAARDDVWFPTGVDTRDVIEAAVACQYCLPLHVDALVSTRDANAPAPRIVEPSAWVDPPRQPHADGGTSESEDTD